MLTALGSAGHGFRHARRPVAAALSLLSGAVLLATATCSSAQWRVLSPSDQRQAQPPKNYSDGTPIKVGDACPDDQKFRWLVAELETPSAIGTEATAGKVVGLQVNCGDGGEVWVNDALQARFDNDHPALAVLSESALPGRKIRVGIQVYAHVQGGDKFDQANWVIIDPRRAREPLLLTLDAQRAAGKVPEGIVGLSQGGGMSDYDEATARKLKEGGFKWFRMDNIFTGVLKAGQGTNRVYDWADFDRRVDFVARIGADPIMAVSYMPQVLDAVPNNDRQSAPRDYAAWEEMCFQAAQHSLQRGKRIPFWEVWNEVNSGWLKPGPEDTGSDAFKDLYTAALGKEEKNHEVVRRFEAYCKLYRATARGVRRADPQARIGGPALASGPFENSDYGHCQHGKGFARGLMLWCQQEKLPLDFVSWHEYFQSPETIVKEADAFRSYLADFPELKRSVTSFMITEWNEAWWADRPQDHELGAAWCANSVTRAFLPAHIDRPCFFYVKQGDMNFRGDYSLLMKDNLPKASYNVARIFNSLHGSWLPVAGTDDDISAIASWDPNQERLSVVLVNFRDRYALRRPVQLRLDSLPSALKGGRWRESVVDATHSNAWNDQSKAELAVTRSGEISGQAFSWENVLPPNSVTLIELGN
jgi:xylan 1,4-beta-xylosidase